MARHILRCSGCGNYTMSEEHSCGAKAFLSIPPKYSPEDKYGRYRRESKKQNLVDRGLL